MSDLLSIVGDMNTSRKADVVFVPGLGGDALATWRHGKDDSTSWPHWLGREFPELGVWTLDYSARRLKQGSFFNWFTKHRRESTPHLTLAVLASQVLDTMVQHNVGSRPLLFICHSLGGLVVKQLLRNAIDAVDSRTKQVALNTRAVLFLATPHAGAEQASLVESFRRVLGTLVSIEDLQAPLLESRALYDWYRNRSSDLGIQTVTYYELRGVRGAMPIVTPTSSHPGIGAYPVGLDEDHVSIAKPRSPAAQVCSAARELLRNHVLAPSRIPPPPPADASAQTRQEVNRRFDGPSAPDTGARSVPYELPPAAEKFVGRQAEKERLAARLREGRSTAVVGPAGMGKTALAAAALRAVVGDTPGALAASPFPDGVVLMDLYACRGRAEPAWNTLANKLAGVGFMEHSLARDRAAEACRARRILVIVEGGEEADGMNDRAEIKELLSVLSPQNRWLLLTRLRTQVPPAESLELKEALRPSDAANLFDSLTEGRVAPIVRDRLLELFAGHPLAITWAGNLLARDDDPERLAGYLIADQLSKLSDPRSAEQGLFWLFNRSVRDLDDAARQALAAAGLLSYAPFPIAAMLASLNVTDTRGEEGVRDALRSLVQRGLLQRSEEEGHWHFTGILGYRFARKETGSDPTLRERLGRWLWEDLATTLASNAAEVGPRALTALLDHAAALLRADDDQRLWIPLAHDLLYEASDRLADLARLDLAGVALSAVAGWLERFPAEKADSPTWLRERSFLLDRQGFVLSTQGDLAGALASYRGSLEVMQRLADADPSNLDRQRDLSVSQAKMGDVLSARGDLAGALAAYRQALAMMQRLAAVDPSHVGWQWDLSVSRRNMGEALRDAGDPTGALEAYREALAVMQRLATAEPTNVGWQRDVGVCHNRVGDLLSDQGDLTGALVAYREALHVRQQLAASDPNNAAWQRDLSASHNKVGDALRGQGDLASALVAYREALQVRQRLAAADLSNPGWQRDLSVSHSKVGDTLCDQGDLAGALVAYRESLAMMRQLVAVDPSNVAWQRDLSVIHNKLGEVLSAQGDLAGALAAYREALAMMQWLATADPSNAGWQRDLSVSQARVGDVLSAQGDVNGALAAYRESLVVRQRLATADPSNAWWQRALSFTLTRMAEFYERQGNVAESRRFAEDSLEIDERLASLDPTNATWQKDLAVSRALVDRLRR
jgi:tetratricopeptide (TPR) repeat protein